MDIKNSCALEVTLIDLSTSLESCQISVLLGLVENGGWSFGNTLAHIENFSEICLPQILSPTCI